MGIIILLYVDRFVTDLKNAFADDVHLGETWNLLTWLLWILVAWLFVDAALTVALSITEHKVTLADVMERLDAIEKRLGPSKPKDKARSIESSSMVSAEEVPPPPLE